MVLSNVNPVEHTFVNSVDHSFGPFLRGTKQSLRKGSSETKNQTLLGGSASRIPLPWSLAAERLTVWKQARFAQVPLRRADIIDSTHRRETAPLVVFRFAQLPLRRADIIEATHRR